MTTFGNEQLAPPRGMGDRLLDVALWLAGLFAWAVVALALLGVLGFLVGAILIPMLGAGAPFLLTLLLVLIASLLSALRRRRAGAVITYLEQATRLNLPLPAMLRAAERSERGQTRRALYRLRAELEAGQTVYDAVAVALPGVSQRTLGLIGSAERSGRLPDALARLTRENVTRFDGRPGAELYLRWYPPTMLLMIALVVGAVYLFVLPKFFEIFQDFSIELPPLTVALGRTWDVLAVPLAVVAVSATLAYVGVLLASIVSPRFVGRGPLRWFVDRLAWRIPGPAGVTRWRGLADACNVMADALETGRPLDWALAEASRSGTNGVLAERLARWADHARAGIPAADGARRAGLPPLITGLLRTVGGADLADVFRFLARYYDSRFARSVVMVQAAMVPALSIAAGVVVGTIVLALFLPLIRLVDHIAGTPWSF